LIERVNSFARIAHLNPDQYVSELGGRAHMVNTEKAIDWAISKGANGLKADLNFDNAGNPTDYKHGGSFSDCSCKFLTTTADHVCSVISRNDTTPAATLLRFIATKQSIALHIVDTKMNDQVNQEAAGANVIKLLESNLFGAGYQGSVIVGVSHTKYIAYIQTAARAAAVSPYVARISFTFDGEGNDNRKVFAALNKINSIHRAYGTGITSCWNSDFYSSITPGCVQEHRGAQGLTYIWTIDSKNSMTKYLHAGARGIITNMLGELQSLLNEYGIALAKPETHIPPAKTPLT